MRPAGTLTLARVGLSALWSCLSGCLNRPRIHGSSIPYAPPRFALRAAQLSGERFRVAPQASAPTSPAADADVPLNDLLSSMGGEEREELWGGNDGQDLGPPR